MLFKRVDQYEQNMEEAMPSGCVGRGRWGSRDNNTDHVA